MSFIPFYFGQLNCRTPTQPAVRTAKLLDSVLQRMSKISFRSTLFSGPQFGNQPKSSPAYKLGFLHPRGFLGKRPVLG